MFEAFASYEDVEAMIRREYGERAGYDAVSGYKKNVWNPRQQRDLERRAAAAACRELVAEGRN